MNHESGKEKILILGLGNILLGDEGIGVKVVQGLEKEDLPDHIDLLDGGTGGFYILSVLEQYKTIIMIDATIDENPPGTLALVEPEFASDFPKVLSSHDIGLRDLIESAALLEHLPKIYLITISIHPDQDINMELSPEIKDTIPNITGMIRSIIAELA
jgi:hydrogenase maturation protease